MQNQGMNIQIKLYAYLNKYDTRLTEEKIAIEKAIRELHFSSEYVNNKKIILKLLSFLSYTDDVVEKDIIRNALEVVLLFTSDDI
ncbi:biofilm development regulator YmgB/AriR family protein [Escherichia coli]|uniref:biofilm development regulator YmgB/AriR family protein n=1 Tax=Escherichia coli TaxID=562 RepID=UPI0010221271|nr:biofilm development regulator YmgB/AriR family protein [Escherichia coli]MEC4623136.1 biofilm development regulator YmgB/AriR family protein [Escherichia coli]